jgi:hypothetical protein
MNFEMNTNGARSHIYVEFMLDPILPDGLVVGLEP